MDFSMDASVFVFLCAVCLGTGVVFGLAPALQLSRSGASDMLRESAGRTVTAGKWTRRWSGALVVAEVVLTVVLLAGAVAMMRYSSAESDVTREIDTSRMSHDDACGFPPRLPSTQERIAVLSTARGASREYADHFDRRSRRCAAAVEAKQSRAVGRRPSPIEGERLPMVDVVNVGARYFETIGLRAATQAGRLLRTTGHLGAQSVVVDQRFVDRFFPQVIRSVRPSHCSSDRRFTVPHDSRWRRAALATIVS